MIPKTTTRRPAVEATQLRARRARQQHGDPRVVPKFLTQVRSFLHSTIVDIATATSSVGARALLPEIEAFCADHAEPRLETQLALWSMEYFRRLGSLTGRRLGIALRMAFDADLFVAHQLTGHIGARIVEDWSRTGGRAGTLSWSLWQWQIQGNHREIKIPTPEQMIAVVSAEDLGIYRPLPHATTYAPSAQTQATYLAVVKTFGVGAGELSHSLGGRGIWARQAQERAELRLLERSADSIGKRHIAGLREVVTAMEHGKDEPALRKLLAQKYALNAPDYVLGRMRDTTKRYVLDALMREEPQTQWESVVAWFCNGTSQSGYDAELEPA